MDLQQQHAGTVDKQGKHWPCTFWSGYQREKNPPSVLWQMFLLLQVCTHSRSLSKMIGIADIILISAMRGRSRWQFQLEGQIIQIILLLHLKLNKYQPCTAAISCTYLYRERNKVSSGPNLALYTVPLCDFTLCRKSKYLTQPHQKKENKQSTQPQKKALNFGIHFLCNSSTAHALLTSKAHCKTQLFI